MYIPSKKLLRPGGFALSEPFRTRDSGAQGGWQTFDRQSTIDSAGTFLVGELERLDPELHKPLLTYTWSRDIDLREDVSVADDASSFTNSAWAGPGGINPAGKNWASTAANAIAGISIDIGKTVNPLTPWATELSWSLFELQQSIKVGRPIDSQKYEAMQDKYNMDVDEQVYVGDSFFGFFGLCNSPLVTPSNVVAGTGGGTTWASKQPDEILADVNSVLTAAWNASGLKYVPTKVLLPPNQFALICSARIPNTGEAIITYLERNTIGLRKNGAPTIFAETKWLPGIGVGGTDRMVAYTQRKNLVRIPLVPLGRTPLEYRSLWQSVTYYGRIGVVEVVYPETIAYRDGI